MVCVAQAKFPTPPRPSPTFVPAGVWGSCHWGKCLLPLFCVCLHRDYSHQNDARQQRSFFVKCVGEGVDDNGGPYRAVVGAATGEEPAGPLEMLVRTIALCLLLFCAAC
jgi:hypothetical protein